MSNAPLHLFEGYGIELEYMIVHQKTLSVLPISDQILYAIAGEYVEDVDRGPISWSNELVLHVIELKTNGPSPQLEGLPQKFQTSILEINQILEKHQGKLMGSGMHPWMNPEQEMKLWPHNYNEVYEEYNRIFNCRHHGWSNLQSTHINLPFANDEEFGRLHAAIRLVLPIIPALTASTPIVESKISGKRDTRLEIYRKNQVKVPSIAGQVIPEPVFTRKDYEEQIFQRIFRDIAPHDPKKILQKEWLNSRGAIARFDRNAIEIRILDIQECPQADIAIVATIVALIRALVEEHWISFESQKKWDVEELAPIFLEIVESAEDTMISNSKYLTAMGMPNLNKCTARELWQNLQEKIFPDVVQYKQYWKPTLDLLFQQGTLSSRILRAVGENPTKEDLFRVYEQLTDCLRHGKLFQN